ncbi:hypothetical protein KAFR_0B03110 [Kazachstania africana CBS 2517]|uniref:Transferrin receptor-like dimerisation domain-containing protein n=1 Tax=Kazachstania africana (strain ATCC 22294 / BCRC 22015 / CBS 2517 / CECT 1963 / NBRC 1671 / NRRL Y-8276) TaxID=1071382 RepID=H2AQF7_KAZAF|nr:hypothetical protein KAFR_0B03110 [Kazachstania africana CBS 2517]CCF56607.1 hypothetical protein KAFR_0B03110 [Kazachstania africana CBS 2517]
MRLPRLTSRGYNQVSTTEGEPSTNNLPSAAIDDGLELPLEPPSYDALEQQPLMEEMGIEEPIVEGMPIYKKMHLFFSNFRGDFILPVRRRVVDPLVHLINISNEKIDFYIAKIGNPLILRRFLYIFLMTGIAFFVMSSGFLPVDEASGSRGMFTNHNVLLEYARRSIDLSKLERDLEYISSMPHMSGTKGDAAVRHYILESLNNNNLKLVKEFEYSTYSNYPGESSLTILKEEGDDVVIELNSNNFNSLGANGYLENVNLIYGNEGTIDDLESLQRAGLLNDDYVLLINYSGLVSEQIMTVQKFKAKGVIFISDKFDGNGDVVQMKPVAIPQYGAGDILTPGWHGPIIDGIDPNDSNSIPHIPTLPLSFNQGQKILDSLSKDGVQFKNGLYSGKLYDVSVRLKVENTIREHQLVQDIIGKIDGREQNDKAIIIAASRTSMSNGAIYPSFGTALLLSLIQLFQEMKYKYDWKPLRNIYFISYGGTEFNYAGSTELMEERLAALKDEVYTHIDISQLGIWNTDKKLNIQTHPLLNKFFRDEETKMGFDISVEEVHQFGDWISSLANGIPVSVISSPDVLNRVLPIDTFEDTFENIKPIIRNPENDDIAVDLFLYLFQTFLKIVDNPLIPFDLEDSISITRKLIKDFEESTDNKLDFSNMAHGLDLWQKIGSEWAGWVRAWEHLVYSNEEGIEPSLISVHRWTWNRKLSNIGRRQCASTGLPDRPFYKNVLFSPSLWTEGSKTSKYWTFPGVWDALYGNNWKAAQEQLDLVSNIFSESAEIFIEETTDVGL